LGLPLLVSDDFLVTFRFLAHRQLISSRQNDFSVALKRKIFGIYRLKRSMRVQEHKKSNPRQNKAGAFWG
jgi:hypothetical protein